MNRRQFEAWLYQSDGRSPCKECGCVRVHHPSCILDGFELKRVTPTGARGASAGSELPFVYKSACADRKLSPVEMLPNTTDRLRPTPVGPFVDATYASIEATCPESCPFKRAPDGGPGACFSMSGGFTGKSNRIRDCHAERFTAPQVGLIEARGIQIQYPDGVPQDGGRDGKSGRDLRLHIGGEAPDALGARAIAAAVQELIERGLGKSWTYTHRWDVRAVGRRGHIGPADWGPIAAWASVERPQDMLRAREAGYPIAVTVDHFPNGRKVFDFGGVAVQPCLAETRGKTCVNCRICLEPPKAFREGRKAIGFQLHGTGSGRVRLDVLQGRELGKVA